MKKLKNLMQDYLIGKLVIYNEIDDFSCDPALD